MPLDLGPDGFRRSGAVVERLTAIAQGDRGLGAYVTGPAGYAAEASKAFNGIDGTLLYGTLLVVVLILLISYRSPVLWLLPVASAGVALVAAEAVIYELASRAILTVNSLSVGILTVLVFGAGTDYAPAPGRPLPGGAAAQRGSPRRDGGGAPARRAGDHRQREHCHPGPDVPRLCRDELDQGSGTGRRHRCRRGAVDHADAAARAPRHGRPAGVLAHPPDVRDRRADHDGTVGATGRSHRGNPRPVWIATALLLGVMALGVTTLHASGLTNSQSYRGHPSAVVGEEIAASHFPAGGEEPGRRDRGGGSATSVRNVLAVTPGIASVTPPVVRNGLVYLQGTLRPPPDSQAA